MVKKKSSDLFYTFLKVTLVLLKMPSTNLTPSESHGRIYSMQSHGPHLRQTKIDAQGTGVHIFKEHSRI